MGPTPPLTPTTSRATSAQHGSFERNTHSDVFGRRLPNSRMNSPRPSRVRSATADAEEDDRRSERSDRFPLGMKQRVEAIEMTLRLHASDIGTIKSQSQEIYIKLKKTDADHQGMIQNVDRTFGDWS